MWKVLLVEDETFVRESVKEIIRWEEMGFTLAGEASNGLEALPMIKNDPPDLVLCDIVMPQMDGLELLQETRKAGIGSKFVMLTCIGDFESMRRAMEYGASNYILKLSMSVKDLRETLVKVSRELSARQSPIERPVRQPAAREKITHPEVNKIMEYIEQNYDQDITLKSLARYVMMGENYVSALFKKKTGETLIHYLHRTRVEKAIEYLTTTDLPVNRICQNVGFMNDNYFIKIFKRMTGMTPSQYRMKQ
ncbi:YesN/AraC family two-component response regulator [Paenibacillus rhizosphaerae]|uniref:YesN/AraC family two-component response regulator n=1 Tax=Paenibacillus rhizosphaerae TaxID=297318 RepID=A0A839TIT5_9BACL|nr:helix-turn-helix domain-containing protein [Paenibacillus rhizosphaerae]MBB3126624.1 YesN/AraC family two-component response regulator [Paenibacillus rhizosphaerae]